MPCEICGHTVQNLGVQGRKVFWCPRCGSKRNAASMSKLLRPDWCEAQGQLTTRAFTTCLNRLTRTAFAYCACCGATSKSASVEEPNAHE